MRLDYLTKLYSVLKESGVPIAGEFKPTREGNGYFPVDKSGYGKAGFCLRVWVTKKRFEVGLSLSDADWEAVFSRLEREKDTLGEELPQYSPLEWKRLRKSARISTRFEDVDTHEKSDWRQQHEWIAVCLNEMFRVFAPRIKHMHRAKRQGDRVVHFEDGAVEEGPYLAGKRHGHWVLRFPDGEVHEGPYVKGREHGQWQMRSADGSLTEGFFVDGEQRGQWTLRDVNGSVYEGPFVDGKQHGHWVLRNADGSVHEGPYVEGVQRCCWRVCVSDEVFSLPVVAGQSTLDLLSLVHNQGPRSRNFIGRLADFDQ